MMKKLLGVLVLCVLCAEPSRAESGGGELQAHSGCACEEPSEPAAIGLGRWLQPDSLGGKRRGACERAIVSDIGS